MADDTPRPPLVDDELERIELADLTEQTDLVDAEVTATVTGQRAEHLSIAGSRVRSSRLGSITVGRFHLTHTVVAACDFATATLENASLRNVVFDDCRLTGAVLADADLRDVVFRGCQLDDANLRQVRAARIAFESCSLARADLGESTLGRVSFENCDLTGARMQRVRAERLRFRDCTWDGVIGAASLAGSVVGPADWLPLAQRLLAELQISVEDDLHDRS